MSTTPEHVTRFSEDSPSVHTHLGILQSVVQRMADNSASCKTWCITIVSAVMVVVADKSNPNLFWLAILPIPVFLVLDVYYLALEKGFRDSYSGFVRKLHCGTLAPEDLYTVAPPKEHAWLRFEAFKSFSVWGFYVPLGALVYVAKQLVA